VSNIFTIFSFFVINHTIH